MTARTEAEAARLEADEMKEAWRQAANLSGSARIHANYLHGLYTALAHEAERLEALARQEKDAEG